MMITYTCTLALENTKLEFALPYCRKLYFFLFWISLSFSAFPLPFFPHFGLSRFNLFLKFFLSNHSCFWFYFFARELTKLVIIFELKQEKEALSMGLQTFRPF